MSNYQVKDVLQALNVLTGGRVITSPGHHAGGNPFVVTKTSGIPGKAITELPGLVWGNLEQPIKKIGVLMTLTESAIELAGATGVDALISHHPIGEGSNTGGVIAKYYSGLYKLALFELHEAFHGLHPGIAWIHGSKALKANIAFGGEVGKIVWYGEALPEVDTLQDFLDRVDKIMGTETENQVLEAERKIRACSGIYETSVAARAKIFVGKPESKLGKTITIFPHTGFNPSDLEKAYAEYPADTLVANISRPLEDNPLIDKAKELGMNFVAGNSHALEIFENGIPLAYALQNQLPGLEVCLFRERMTSIPLKNVGNQELKDYGQSMADLHLPKK